MIGFSGPIRMRSTAADASGRVVFDDACRFCRFSLAVLLSLDRRSAFVPVSFTTAGAAGIFEAARDDWRRSFHLLVDERRRAGGDAFPQILSLLPGGRPLSRVAGACPGICRAVYRAVADRRALFGRFLPSGAVRWADAVIARRESAAI